MIELEYLSQFELDALNDLIEMGITKRQDMIDFINDCEVDEESKAFERSIKRSDERLIEALNSWSDEYTEEVIKSYPLTFQYF